MLYIDFEAATEAEAVQLALDSLGLTRDDITYEVLEKEKKGLFGLGKSQKAKVRIFYKEKSELNHLIEKVKTLLLLLEPGAKIEVNTSEDNKYVISVESEESSHLIGRGGKNLQAIQNVVNAMLQKNQNKYKILIDIDRYYARKEKSVLEQAVAAAVKVQKFKKPIFLQPMNPFERRLVHMELKKMNGILTESEGVGSIKKIRISWQGEGSAQPEGEQPQEPR
jgi:spoIIIJ-associated protein